jgi:tRNA-dihydrouridine synthase 3
MFDIRKQQHVGEEDGEGVDGVRSNFTTAPPDTTTTNNNTLSPPLKEEQQQGDQWWWRQDDTIPPPSCPSLHLPLPPSPPQPSLNHLNKDLVQQLRKDSYDFTKTDVVLERLGYRNNSKTRREKKKTNKNENEKKRPHTDVGGEDEEDDGNKKQGGDAGFITNLGQREQEEGGKEDDVTPATTITNTVVDKVEKDTDTNPREASHHKHQAALNFRDKLFLAPLTTLGNLPFRRLAKRLGADITCGEMALATNILQGQASEWALLRRHPDEDCFGVQLAGGFPDVMAAATQLISEQCSVDFIDCNFGCPIDLVCGKGAGASCLRKPSRVGEIVKSMSTVAPNVPITLKMRKGYGEEPIAHTIIPKLKEWGAVAATLHGRTREQRYSKLADWSYINQCAAMAQETGVQLVGNGDIYSWQDHYKRLEDSRYSPLGNYNNEGEGEGGLATTYIARGALIKPWLFTEIKQRQDWDISASERLDLYKQFCSLGLEHWGSDERGVASTRRFFLEWLSFTHRYIPVGLLDHLPAQMNWRAAPFVGRSDLETLLASGHPRDWVKISEMLLGPAPAGFVFMPKHKANATTYDRDAFPGGGNSSGNVTSKGEEEQENG